MLLSSRPTPRNVVACSAALLLVAALFAACGSAGPTPSGSPSSATFSALASPANTVTASPSPRPFSVVMATSCDPSQVPYAAPVPSSSPAVSARFTLMVPILMYHRIVPFAEAGNSLSSLVVPPAKFSDQLTALSSAGWHTITLSALADDLAAGVKPPPKTFVITIDDGWEDGYIYALPILEGHGFVATYFMVASRIDRPDFLSAEQLRTIIANGSEVGDHTMTHIDVAGGTSATRIYQIDAAAATIASATGRWPDVFAYPSGAYSLQAEATVQACTGMKMAVIEGDGTYETWANRFATPRVKVYPGTSPAALLQWVENPWLPAPPTAAPTGSASQAPSSAPTAAPPAPPTAAPSA
jgi:peptidoglycan/xylan/chitin deacetylase (PgdA/CDA1 family)